MLRRGDDYSDIAELTGVPPALLEIIDRELNATARYARCAEERRVARARHTRRCLLAVLAGAIANIVACILALIQPGTALTMFTALAAATITAAFWLLARTSRPGDATQPRQNGPAPGSDTRWKGPGRQDA